MMEKAWADAPLKGGFNFDLCRRNEMLSGKGIRLPGFRKTGTTIVGLLFEAKNGSVPEISKAPAESEDYFKI